LACEPEGEHTIMAMTVILHFSGEDAIVGDMEELPAPTQQYIIIRNPRRRDGKRVGNIEAEAKAVLYPLSRITYVELMSEVELETAGRHEAASPGTTIFGFFREDDQTT
jgi:hypothetical protein